MIFGTKMLKKYIVIFFLIFSIFVKDGIAEGPKKIGLLIVATGKYIQFVEPLIKSAEKHFCTNHDVTFFVFTDGKAPEGDTILSIYQKRLGWPYDTMMRFEMYAKRKEMLCGMDYIFACDSDMLFVDEVGDEILGDRVATLHPGYLGTAGTPERRSISKACIPYGKNKQYFCGGFYGGKAEEFLKMAEICSRNIQDDLNKSIIAAWHDESHLNRYFFDNEPTIILSPSYCYPEYPNGKKGPWINYHKKIVALFKADVQDYRN